MVSLLLNSIEGIVQKSVQHVKKAANDNLSTHNAQPHYHNAKKAVEKENDFGIIDRIFFLTGREVRPMVFRNSIRKVVVAASVAFMMTTAFARATNYWVGASGNWSDKSNWYLDSAGTIPATRCPGGVTNTIDGVDYRSTDDMVFFTSTATGTINIDVDATIYAFIVSSQKNASYADLTFTGAGTLTCKSGSNSSGSRPQINGHKVVFQDVKMVFANHFAIDGGSTTFASGADITLGGQLYSWHNNAKVYFLDGCTINASYLTAQYPGASHIVKGGMINASLSIPANVDATIEIAGGWIKAATIPSIYDGATFIFTNGTLVVAKADTVSDKRLLGTGDAVFIATYNNSNAIIPAKEDGETIVFNHVQVTNGTGAAMKLTNSVTISGNRLDASRLVIAGEKEVTLDLPRLNVGKYIYPAANNCSLSVPHGITFGAFGDWTVNDKTFSINLGGDVVFDTTDCFDGVTRRYPTVSKISTMLDTALTVTGLGGVTMVFSSVPYILPRLTVDDGASLTYVNNNSSLVVDDLTMGAGSTLSLKCNMGTLDVANATIDPTASISVQVNANLPNAAYPVLSSPDDATAEALAARTTLIGDGSADFSIRSGAHCVYLANGEEPTYGETGASNIWTGAVNGDWNNAGNWISGVVPYSSSRVTTGVGNAAYFGGTRNMDVTNTISGTTYLTRMAFLSSCGPLRISGGKLYFGSNGYENTGSSPIYSFSSFPVIIDSDVQTQNALSVVDSRDSYIALNGTTTITGFFRPSGEIRVGGTLTCGSGVLMKSKSGSGRSTKVHVLRGGKVIATTQKTNLVTSATRYVVDAGGEMVFKAGTRSVHGHYTTVNPALVNGDIDFQCPYFSSKVQRYYGTGTVHFASVQSHAFGSSSIIFGGGITLKPKSWTTVTADAPDNYIKIAVTNNAILSAAANWTYGPEAGVATTTTAAERALEIADGATLTVKTDGYTVSFADPIAGKGDLVIADGSKVALADDLLAEAKGGWTTFATVGSFTCADGVFPESYRIRTVDNGDGTLDVQARVKPSFAITIQ